MENVKIVIQWNKFVKDKDKKQHIDNSFNKLSKLREKMFCQIMLVPTGNMRGTLAFH